MCGRLAFFEPQNLKTRYGLKQIRIDLTPHYNFAPGMSGPVIINGGGREAALMKWGLTPTWAKDPKIGYKMINARAETILEKPSYKKPFLSQRCLVPANGFFEWQKLGRSQPYYIYEPDQSIMSLAGIYDNQTFSIITTRPNQEMTPIHNRMPVIVDFKNENDWLNPRTTQENLLKLLAPFPNGRLNLHPINKLVNSPMADSPEIIQPT